MDKDEEINNPKNEEENKDDKNDKSETPSCKISSNIDNLDKSFEIDEAEFDSF